MAYGNTPARAPTSLSPISNLRIAACVVRTGLKREEEEEEEAKEAAAAAAAEEEAEEEEAGTWYRGRERSRLRPLYRFSLSRPLSLPLSLSEPPGGLAPVLKKLGSVKLKLAKTSFSLPLAVDGVTPSASSSSFFNGSSISHSCVYDFYNKIFI
jgi:hypothetical protein